MKKIRFAALLLLIILLPTLCAGCAQRREIRSVEKELGIDLDGAKLIAHSDTHGGFLGDGTMMKVLDAETLAVPDEWQELPMDQTAQALAYGCMTEDGFCGPMLTDEKGDPLLPEIGKGRWKLIDRQENAEGSLLERYSFNFTLAVYDAENGLLYVLRMDT